MKRPPVLPVTLTVLFFLLLAVTGNLRNIHINAASIGPLFCMGGLLLLAYDFKSLLLMPERANRNDDLPELTDEEFREHHRLCGELLEWYALPQVLPFLYFGEGWTIVLSLVLFFLPFFGVYFYVNHKYRPIVEERRNLWKKERELQEKRESGWR